MMAKLSIIVPVYNTEVYLPRCIDSILAQTFTDFELLLIDDGSKDNSGTICDEYAAKDSRVRVFHKENGGVSSARNFGLDNAQGEWITFVDSDDWVEKEGFYRLFHHILASDLVVSSFIYETTENKVIERTQRQTIVINSENLTVLLMGGVFMVPYCKLYKREIIKKNKIRFNAKIHSGEDSLFVFSYLLHINSISIIDDITYHYCITGDGLSTKSISINESLYLLDCFYSVLKQFESKHPGYDMSKRYLWLTHEIFYKITKTFIIHKEICKRSAVYKELLTSRHFISLFNDRTILPKGAKRYIFDYLGMNKHHILLAFYSYYYDYR